ncbi:MAG: AmmeMemoRadiSam system radical SAM enzyme [Planctomycetota bacterium]|nr:MAG: AmmeMemoRadiSam system radical SAM enzyme [Planctomycetota bacterium]
MHRVKPNDGHPARWWHPLEGEDGRVRCDLCPRYCKPRPGQRGFCYVRANRDGRMVLETYGRSSGFCVDPIEKKPLNHFLPGSPILSFGTAGCNLGCQYCQNWDISKARTNDRLQAEAGPEAIAEAARELGCQSVAFTYNDPVIFAEYAIDTAAACHDRGIRTVAVTAGYITAEARSEFFDAMDAANVDLKGFSEDFYQKLCAGHLQPVLDTLRYLVHETDVWVELTTLLIPGHNDGDEELKRMSEWVIASLGPHVPLHFTAFHPDFRMRDVPPTPPATLRRARTIAKEIGLEHVYTGNVSDPEGQSTYCPGCGEMVVQRDGYEIGRYALDAEGRCRSCGTRLPGRFAERPGTWGRRRLPVRIG